MNGSIQRQLRKNLLVALTLVMSVLLALMHQGIAHLTDNYVKARLQHDAESLLAALQKSPTGEWQVDANRLTSIYQRVESGHYFQVTTPANTLASRSLWDKTPTAAPLATGQQRFSRLAYNDEQQWLVWEEGIRMQGDAMTLWLAEDVTTLDNERRAFTLVITLLILTATLLLVLWQSIILRRQFGAFDAVQRAIHELPAGGQLPAPTTVPEEVRPLVGEIARLLEQLETRIRRSRNAMGNLTHELKRPLQLLHGQVDSLPTEAQAPFTHTLDQMQHLIERELRRARIAGAAAPGRQFVPGDDLPHLVEAMARIYPQTSIRVQHANPLILHQDRDDMLEFLGNLLDNACKHAHRNITLEISADNAGVDIRVDDDGAGVADADIARLDARGVKLDESREGHGIGLALCRDIVESYAGSLHFERSPLGGLAVRVRLPTR